MSKDIPLPSCSWCGKTIEDNINLIQGKYYHNLCVTHKYGNNPPEQDNDVMSYHIGSSNYSNKKIQPWHIWEEYSLNPWDADIIKRTLRKKENQSRREDYEKIKHICDKRISQIDAGIKMYGESTVNPALCDQCLTVFSSKFNFCPECGYPKI